MGRDSGYSRIYHRSIGLGHADVFRLVVLPGMGNKGVVSFQGMRKKTKPISHAVAADIWEDRPDKSRPTPERMTHGRFVLRDSEDAGVTFAVDELATELDRLFDAGKIDADQRQGGLDFAALMERTRLGSKGRSCLNMDPVGYEGEESEASIRDSQDRSELYLACGVLTWRQLRQVCQEDLPATDMGRLRHGLDLCVRFWIRRR